jgi:hypothetical protein
MPSSSISSIEGSPSERPPARQSEFVVAVTVVRFLFWLLGAFDSFFRARGAQQRKRQHGGLRGKPAADRRHRAVISYPSRSRHSTSEEGCAYFHFHRYPYRRRDRSADRLGDLGMRRSECLEKRGRRTWDAADIKASSPAGPGSLMSWNWGVGAGVLRGPGRYHWGLPDRLRCSPSPMSQYSPPRHSASPPSPRKVSRVAVL